MTKTFNINSTQVQTVVSLSGIRDFAVQQIHTATEMRNAVMKESLSLNTSDREAMKERIATFNAAAADVESLARDLAKQVLHGTTVKE